MEYLLERGDYLEAKAYASTSEKLREIFSSNAPSNIVDVRETLQSLKYRQIFRYWCQRRTLFSFKMSTV